MADQEERGRCVLCGGAVGPGGRTLTPLPQAALQLQRPAAPVPPVEDANDHLTPVQRFARAMKRRDAARPKPPSPRGKQDNPQTESGRGCAQTVHEVLRAEVRGIYEIQRSDNCLNMMA